MGRIWDLHRMNDFPFICSKCLIIKGIFCFARLRDKNIYCFVLFRFHLFIWHMNFINYRPFRLKGFTYVRSNIIIILVTQDELKMKLTIISFSPYFLGQYIIRLSHDRPRPTRLPLSTPSSLLSAWVTASLCQSNSITSSRHLNTTRSDLALWKHSRLEWSVNQQQRLSRPSRWPLPVNP